MEPAVQRLVFGRVQVGHEPLHLDGLPAGQTQRILVSQYLFTFLVDELLRKLAIGNRLGDGFELSLGIRGVQHDVVARQQGQQRRGAEGRSPFHFQGVGEDEPLETQRVAQQVVHDFARERGRSARRVQRGDIQVAHHDARQPAVDVAFEGFYLHAQEPLFAVGHEWQRVVRILRGVAVAREMFGHRHYPLGFEPPRIGDALGRDVVERLSERAFADNRIAGVAVDVEHRGKVDLYAHATALSAYGPPVFIEKRVVLNGSQGHVEGKLGRVGQAHGQPPFAVEGHEQRNLRQSLAVVGEGRLVLHRSRVEKQSAHLQLPHEASQRLAVLGRVAVAYGDDKQLGRALCGRESVEYRVGPLFHLLSVGLP